MNNDLLVARLATNRKKWTSLDLWKDRADNSITKFYPSGMDYEIAYDLSRFRNDPLGFILYSFPWKYEPIIQKVEMPKHYQDLYQQEHGVDAWAIDFLEDVALQMREGNFPIRFSTSSGHGIGKSTLCSWLVLWIMSTIPYTQGIVSAGTADQVRRVLWTELKKWLDLSLNAHWWDYTSTIQNLSFRSLQHPETWRCVGLTAREENSENFAGQHSAAGSSLYIFDEASAIPDKIFEVREGGTVDSKAFTFDFGNPTKNSGRFYENTEGRFKHRYNTRSIDSRSVSILKDSALFKQWADDWGEDSDFFKVRVRGEFPSRGFSEYISLDEVENAMSLTPVANHSAPLVIGIDVARFGDNSTVIYPRMGRDAKSFAPIVIPYSSIDYVANQVEQMVSRFRSLGKEYSTIFVDGVGVGGGLVDLLRSTGYRVVEIHSQHKALDNHFASRGDEMWGRMKDAIGNGLALWDNVVFKNQLIQREYSFTSKGLIKLESKSDLTKRGIQSPDIADALALTYAREVEPMGRDNLNSGSSTYRKPYSPFATQVRETSPRVIGDRYLIPGVRR